jgi:hypothetical protein
MAIDPENWLAVEQVMEDENHVLLQAETTDSEQQTQPQLLVISSHVANGTSLAATFSLVVTIAGRRGVALVDNGSTDTFMDYFFAGQLNYHIANTVATKVIMAGGDSLNTSAIMTDVCYTMQRETFTNNFKLLQLRGYDIILGCDWIKTHSPIGLDLRDYSRQLIIQVTFADFTAPPAGPELKASKLEKYCRTDIMGYVVQVHLMQSEQASPDIHTLPPKIQQVLHAYADVFSDKVGLPPKRNADHKIPLHPNSKPPNVRPYKIPHKQKDEVDKLIKAMLQDNIIRPNSRPYSSPAILVRKKDGSWRLCIDYRELNSQTVKDKSPISVIEDLLDELFGAQIFSKLDLKSGYHQIRI